jgi:hypothetical protein
MTDKLEQLVFHMQVDVQKAIMQVASDYVEQANKLQVSAQDLAYVIGSAAMSAVESVVDTQTAQDPAELQSLANAIHEGIEAKLFLLQGNDPERLLIVGDSSSTLQ